MEEANVNLLSLENDRQFEKIQNLTWLPWVGKNYFNAKRRVLIVAESHYCSGEEIEKYINATMRQKWITRDVVQYYSVSHKNSQPMFDNLMRSFFQTLNIDRENLWKNIAFYNFIQRPMDYNRKERPTKSDISTGWQVFIDVVKILKPTDCIFVGVAAADNFNENISAMNIPHAPIKWIKVDNCKRYARSFSMDTSGISLHCLAIQHTSHHFSWQAWHNFLIREKKEMLKYLDRIANVTLVEEADIQTTDETWTKDIPYWLNHKPIMICNGSELEKNTDLRYISVGRSQWDNTDNISVKTYRKPQGENTRWSRMSEEIPADRLPDMMLILLCAIKSIQDIRKLKEDLPLPANYSHLHEIWYNEEWEFLADQFSKRGDRMIKSLKEIKKLLDEIDINNI